MRSCNALWQLEDWASSSVNPRPKPCSAGPPNINARAEGVLRVAVVVVVEDVVVDVAEVDVVDEEVVEDDVLSGNWGFADFRILGRSG